MTVKICVNIFTSNYCMDNDLEYFSLSPKKPNLADMETVTGFISYLIKILL